MATAIKTMGKFTAIGMRTKVEDPTAMVINTCSGNDTADAGDQTHWTWSNPTNRRFEATCGTDENVKAVSTEAMWQGTKLFEEGGRPDARTLAGEWRRGKAKRPIGAWNGEGKDPIRTPGEARRRIYIKTFREQIERWIESSEEVRAMIETARNHNGPVMLRDHDTGRGVERNGPMSHAWVLATWLNTGEWPTA